MILTKDRYALMQEIYEFDDSKKPTYLGLKTFISLAVRRNSDKFDTFLGVTGDKGTGKSNLSIVIARDYVKLMNKKMNTNLKFDIEENVVYSDDPEEIFNKVDSLPLYSCIVFDEAARIILGEDWNSRNSKQLKKMWAEIRTKHLLVVFALPFTMSDVDKKYRNSLFNYWIECPLRNFGLLFEKTRLGFFDGSIYNEIGTISYSDSLNEERKKKAETNALYKIKRIPSFMGVVRWIEIPEPMRTKYYELRDRAVYEKADKEETTEYVPNVKLFNKLRYGFYLLYTYLNEVKGMNLSEVDRVIGLNFQNHSSKERLSYNAVASEPNKNKYGLIRYKPKREIFID